MGGWIRWIAVLVGIEIFLRLSGVNLPNAPDSAVRAGLSWCIDDIHPVRSQDSLALSRSAVRHAKLNSIPESRPNHGVGDARVPARRVENDFSRVQFSASLALSNHRIAGAIFHRAARVKPFRLGVEGDVRKASGNPLDLEQRSFSHMLKQSIAEPWLRPLRIERGCFLTQPHVLLLDCSHTANLNYQPPWRAKKDGHSN